MSRLSYCQVAQSLDGIKQSLESFKKMILSLDEQYKLKIKQLDSYGLDQKSMNKINSSHFAPATHQKVSNLVMTINVQLQTVEKLLQAYQEMCRKQNGG